MVLRDDASIRIDDLKGADPFVVAKPSSIAPEIRQSVATSMMSEASASENVSPTLDASCSEHPVVGAGIVSFVGVRLSPVYENVMH